MKAQEINRIIEDFAKNIAEEVATKRFYEIEEVKAIATTRLSFALTEILRVSVSIYEDEAAKLKAIYTHPDTNGKEKFEIGGQLAVLNHKIKKFKKAKVAQEEGEEYNKLKIFVKHRFGQEVLAEFFTTLTPIQ
jgi:hypothetical protein